MQDSNYGENGTTQRTGNQGGKLKSESRRLGTFSGVGAKHGTYQVRTCGEDSHKPDIPVIGGKSIEKIAGKLVSQLICEADKQLAYHEQQASLLRERIEELKEISASQDSE